MGVGGQRQFRNFPEIHPFRYSHPFLMLIIILLLLVMDVVFRYGLAASLIIPVHLLPLVSLIPSIIFLLLSPLLPESPFWLIRSAYMTDLQKESYRPFHTFPQKSYLPFHPFHFTYVYRQGRAEDAKAVLQRLRGPGYNIEPEVRREKMDQAGSSFGVASF